MITVQTARRVIARPTPDRAYRVGNTRTVVYPDGTTVCDERLASLEHLIREGCEALFSSPFAMPLSRIGAYL